VVEVGGCSGTPDTLACLRSLPYDTFNHAVNSVPSILGYDSVALSYLPRPDGSFMTASPEQLGLEGKVTKIPFIVGDMEDEGTLFALFQSNITTKEEIVDYLYGRYFLHASKEELTELVNLYDDIEEYGSPFRTGTANNWYPQFKRLAAILGDLVFTLTRRGVLNYARQIDQIGPFWSYLNSYYSGLPILGSTHGLDILSVFFGVAPGYATTAFHEYYINFINRLDPNKGLSSEVAYWPTWAENQTIIQIFPDHSEYIIDDFRQPVLDLLLSNITRFHF
jgi:triacylglycerol lipase